MATKNYSYPAPRGTERALDVTHGESGHVFNKKSEYPIYKEAQELINIMRPASDESSLYHLTECFRGFSHKMQKAMVECLLIEYCGRLDGTFTHSFTGVWHVDRILVEIIHILDHDTKNHPYNV